MPARVKRSCKALLTLIAFFHPDVWTVDASQMTAEHPTESGENPHEVDESKRPLIGYVKQEDARRFRYQLAVEKEEGCADKARERVAQLKNEDEGRKTEHAVADDIIEDAPQLVHRMVADNNNAHLIGLLTAKANIDAAGEEMEGAADRHYRAMAVAHEEESAGEGRYLLEGEGSHDDADNAEEEAILQVRHSLGGREIQSPLVNAAGHLPVDEDTKVEEDWIDRLTTEAYKDVASKETERDANLINRLISKANNGETAGEGGYQPEDEGSENDAHNAIDEERRKSAKEVDHLAADEGENEETMQVIHQSPGENVQSPPRDHAGHLVEEMAIKKLRKAENLLPSERKKEVAVEADGQEAGKAKAERGMRTSEPTPTEEGKEEDAIVANTLDADDEDEDSGETDESVFAEEAEKTDASEDTEKLSDYEDTGDERSERRSEEDETLDSNRPLTDEEKEGEEEDEEEHEEDTIQEEDAAEGEGAAEKENVTDEMENVDEEADTDEEGATHQEKTTNEEEENKQDFEENTAEEEDATEGEDAAERDDVTDEGGGLNEEDGIDEEEDTGEEGATDQEETTSEEEAVDKVSATNKEYAADGADNINEKEERHEETSTDELKSLKSLMASEEEEGETEEEEEEDDEADEAAEDVLEDKDEEDQTHAWASAPEGVNEEGETEDVLAYEGDEDITGESPAIQLDGEDAEHYTERKDAWDAGAGLYSEQLELNYRRLRRTEQGQDAVNEEDAVEEVDTTDEEDTRDEDDTTDEDDITDEDEDAEEENAADGLGALERGEEDEDKTEEEEEVDDDANENENEEDETSETVCASEYVDEEGETVDVFAEEEDEDITSRFFAIKLGAEQYAESINTWNSKTGLNSLPVDLPYKPNLWWPSPTCYPGEVREFGLKVVNDTQLFMCPDTLPILDPPVRSKQVYTSIDVKSQVPLNEYCPEVSLTGTPDTEYRLKLLSLPPAPRLLLFTCRRYIQQTPTQAPNGTALSSPAAPVKSTIPYISYRAGQAPLWCMLVFSIPGADGNHRVPDIHTRILGEKEDAVAKEEEHILPIKFCVGKSTTIVFKKKYDIFRFSCGNTGKALYPPSPEIAFKVRNGSCDVTRPRFITDFWPRSISYTEVKPLPWVTWRREQDQKQHVQRTGAAASFPALHNSFTRTGRPLGGARTGGYTLDPEKVVLPDISYELELREVPTSSDRFCYKCVTELKKDSGVPDCTIFIRVKIPRSSAASGAAPWTTAIASIALHLFVG